jgi:hypothetical protein
VYTLKDFIVGLLVIAVVLWLGLQGGHWLAAFFATLPLT